MSTPTSAAIRSWVERVAGGTIRDVAPVQAGLGAATLWRVRREAAEGDLVVRMFAPGADHGARREAAAMRTARDGGVPVPEVRDAGVIDGCPLLVMDWCDGEGAMSALERASPAAARELGIAFGRALGAINALPAPPEVPSGEAWLRLGGAALVPLHDRLRELPHPDRLLHLDYHALNVLVVDGQVAGVIDWANAAMGPPHLDLARTLAIVRSAEIAMPHFPVGSDALAAFRGGLVAGHAEVCGPDPSPGLSAAWAAAMTAEDLAQHTGKPGSWVTEEVLEALRAERDALIMAGR